jgi:carotenoid cleavage dioxygenase-like enzyme
MYKIVLFGLLLSQCYGFSNFVKKITKNPFRQFFAEKRFKPVNEEKTMTILHENELFNQLNHSLYAQIGSNPKYIENSSYSWFEGDGMIHAVLFKDNEITYQNKWIQTDRLQFEDKIGKKVYLYLAEFLDQNGIVKFIISLIKQYLRLIPGVKGTANTALLNTNEKLFALHEGDLPYELNVHYDSFNISTKGRIHIPNLYSTTAHPIKDIKRSKIYLCNYNNYDFVKGVFHYNAFDNNMNFLEQKNISLINNGMIHSTSFTGNKIIIPDMPMKFDALRIFKKKMPLYFDKKHGVTRFGIFDVNSLKNPDWYYFKNNFFVFHFSESYETRDEFIIYACVIKNHDIEGAFVKLPDDKMNESKGVLKEIRLNKRSRRGVVIENEELENLDLGFPHNIDFPLSSKLQRGLIYCAIFDTENTYIRGFLRIHTNSFPYAKPDIFLFEEGTYGVAEPQPVVIEDKEYLITFIEENGKNYISLVDVAEKKIEKIEISARIPPGFHSIHYYV